MGHSYSYLIASLPALQWNAAPPISIAQFLEDCQYVLLFSDYSYVAHPTLLLSESSSAEEWSSMVSEHSAAAQWREFKQGLQGDLARLRVAAVGLQIQNSWQYSNSVYVYNTARAAINAPHPLAAEEIIDVLCWQWLTDMAESCTSDRERLYVYHLQLQLLHRDHQLHSPAALERYQQIYQDVQQQFAFKESNNE